MTLSVTEPTDQELNAMWPYWIRTLAAAINAIEDSSDNITVTTVSVSAGDTALVVGVDLSSMKIEVVLISGVGASAIQYIRGGTEGQIKIFVFQDNDISFVDGDKADGEIYLNQLPVGTTLNAQQDDVIALLNIGGDGSSDYGYWKELWRQISVK